MFATPLLQLGHHADDLVNIAAGEPHMV